MARIPDGAIERLKATASVQRLAEARGVVLMWTSINISSQKSVAMAKKPDGSSPSGHRVLKHRCDCWKVKAITNCYTISGPITRKLRCEGTKPSASSDAGVVFDIVEVLLQRKQQE
jgi:hypothetical protein